MKRLLYFSAAGAVAIAAITILLFPSCLPHLLNLSPPPLPAPPNGFDVRREGVVRGRVETVDYESKTADCARKMCVYTPPGFNKGKTYPVLYLLHGSLADETSWVKEGMADAILDNLFADKKAVPMIVVMPDGNLFRTPNGDPFESDLLCDVIPYVETHYPVMAGRPYRAIAGVSQGADQALRIALAHPERFAYMGGFIGGLFDCQQFERRYQNTLASLPVVATPKLLWLASGKNDMLYEHTQDTLKLLDKHNIRYVYLELAILKKSGGRLKSGSVVDSVSNNATCKRSSPMKREAYRAVDVKQIFVESLVADKAGMAAVVGLDIAKSDFLATVRWSDGRFERPWRAKSPAEIPDVIHRLQRLADDRSLTIAMESTGTYGDALRQALTDAKLTVHRVSGKAVHDYAEIFDGVASQHDGKDAAMVAELAAMGKSSPWPYQPLTEFDQELRYWVERMDVQQRIQMLWLGRLEALLARHWPEATQYLELNSETLLQVSVEYGGPAALAADANAPKRLKSWGRHFLKSEKIERLVKVSAASVGVRQTAVDRRQIQECAQAALSARHEVQNASGTLGKLAQSHATIARQAAVVGCATACVLWVHLGDPTHYHCAEAYRKAMGLNLKERSSGRYQGQLKITKRGPGAVRRWLYFAAMRLVKQPDIVEWYGVKKGQRPKGGKRALIAVMRKLVLGLYVVGVGTEPFDARRLFSPTVGKRSRCGVKQAKKNEQKGKQKV